MNELFIEYHELKKRFQNAENTYYEALTKRSDLLYLVTPHSTMIKENISRTASSPDEKLINYVSQIDEIDSLINSARNDKDMLNYELKKKEIELRKSTNVYDRIYVYKWIERKSVYKFYRNIGYSIRQVYNYINEIKEKLYKK